MFNAIQKRGKLLAVVAGLAGILAMTAMSSGAGARDGVAAPVTSKVAVETRDGQVLATLTINNQGDSTVYVPRVFLKEGEPEGRLFEVRDSSNGDPLDYIGMMVKRPPPTKKDFVAVKPHSKVSNTLDISNSYRFVSGRHAYQISLNAGYLTDLNKLEQQNAIEPAAAVMFAHVGQ
ncbi:MAG TPA: hypothetical protein VFU95_12610 [Telluria sp.]|nr:hypothetical protein [Telluria sp.]